MITPLSNCPVVTITWSVEPASQLHKYPCLHLTDLDSCYDYFDIDRLCHVNERLSTPNTELNDRAVCIHNRGFERIVYVYAYGTVLAHARMYTIIMLDPESSMSCSTTMLNREYSRSCIPSRPICHVSRLRWASI